MRIDRDLVNRALLKAGQTTLTEDDINNNSEAWKTVKQFYLSTMLKTLTRTPWTSAKRRVRLTKLEDTENFSPYENMFLLPADCARALKLNNGMQFIVEGDYLYTDEGRPVLLYITNGKQEPVVKESFTTDEEEPAEPEEPTEETPAEPEEQEDIPGYDNVPYDPNFWEYVETRLASKIVLKITGEMNLYNMLMGEASLIESAAAKASKASGKSKPNGQTYWTDEIVGRL